MILIFIDEGAETCPERKRTTLIGTTQRVSLCPAECHSACLQYAHARCRSRSRVRSIFLLFLEVLCLFWLVWLAVYISLFLSLSLSFSLFLSLCLSFALSLALCLSVLLSRCLLPSSPPSSSSRADSIACTRHDVCIEAFPRCQSSFFLGKILSHSCIGAATFF